MPPRYYWNHLSPSLENQRSLNHSFLSPSQFSSQKMWIHILMACKIFKSVIHLLKTTRGETLRGAWHDFIFNCSLMVPGYQIVTWWLSFSSKEISESISQGIKLACGFKAHTSTNEWSRIRIWMEKRKQKRRSVSSLAKDFPGKVRYEISFLCFKFPRHCNLVSKPLLCSKKLKPKQDPIKFNIKDIGKLS